MHSYQELSSIFDAHFNRRHFPEEPNNLYDAAQYILGLGGKRVRPVAALLGCEMFSDINDDALNVASAIEMFHNFSLIHDDIMDMAPLRRGQPTVHMKWGEATALLAGDVMFAQAYDYLTQIDMAYIKKIIQLFNKTSKEVCEGQQLDMDFENKAHVSLEEYLNMITLKTSVLLAASLQLGALLGGASAGNQDHLYEFGKKLGIAFQIQDDYLDSFGNPDKFGKQVGGDILSNKKTFLLIHALEVANGDQQKRLEKLLATNDTDKVEQVKAIYKECGVDAWATELKQKYYDEAMVHLEDLALVSSRKLEMRKLANYLLERDY